MEKEDPYRVGVIVGSGIGSLATVEKEYEKILEKGPARVNPLMVPLMISNMVSRKRVDSHWSQGKCTVLLQPVHLEPIRFGDAFRAIQYGDADVMFAGGM